MKNLTIDRDAAIAVYRKTGKEGRSVLEGLLGRDNLTADITEQVKTFEDACANLGLAVSDVLSQHDTNDEAVYKKLKVITQALNEGWTPDWDDDDECKYWPWFNMADGFSFHNVLCNFSYSNLGPRLCFKSEALAKYAGTQFLDIYRAFLK